MFEIADLHKTYDKGDKAVHVLRGVSLRCDKAEFVGIFGTSGSGKSTLLHIMGGLDKPDSGSVNFEGSDLFARSGRRLSDFRNRSVGFVFQQYHLLPEFTATENVMLPCLIAGIGRGEAEKRAKQALEHVDLSDRATHRPSELSGGEQQRVALARAIVMRPDFVLADEPTGNLDEENGEKVFAYLERLHKEFKMGIVMVTHNPELLKRMPRRMELKDGVLNVK